MFMARQWEEVKEELKVKKKSRVHYRLSEKTKIIGLFENAYLKKWWIRHRVEQLWKKCLEHML